MTSPESQYAQALFELSAEEGRQEEYLRLLREVSSLFADEPDYLELLSSPAIPFSERISALREALGELLPEYLLSFLELLCENASIRLFDDCVREFELLTQEASGVAAAVVYTAAELTAEEKETIRVKLEAKTGKTVSPSFLTDPALLGGIRVEIGGIVYDDTLRGHLRDVKEVMSR